MRVVPRRFAAIAAVPAALVAVVVSCSSPLAPRRGPDAPPPVPAPGATRAAALASEPAGAIDEPVPLGPLPAGVRPIRESLALDIDPAGERFGGTAEIALRIDRPRRAIWLHGRGLAVHSATLVTGAAPPVTARWDEVDATGVVQVTAPSPVAGDVTLRVVFDAAYDPQLVGVYRAATAAGPAVFSKFEAIYARRAFPCFDEPAFKIPFDVALTVPAAAEVIGNMPIAATAPVGADGARRRVQFQTTPPLPSYLVAFAVGPFERRAIMLPASPERPGPLPVAGVAVRGRAAHTAYALAEAAALLAEQERYFGIGFPYPKLDLIAVPDFQSGAMENAGAITFRDARLLVDDRVASFRDRFAVTHVIAHEVAHQWFGDFVTMRWWDDLWLNEGFATFLAGRTLRAVRPALEAELDTAERTDQVMAIDALASARRIRQPIETTHDITNAFDDITYDKGAAVLTMVEHFVGDAPFRRGLHAFLAGHAHGNATTDELIQALSAASGQPLAPLVASFLDQPGVPLVTAQLRCDAGPPRVELGQTVWRPIGATTSADPRWTIPVCVRYGAGGRSATACTLLDAPSGSLALPVCPDWITPNADAAGYYRSALAAGDLARLRERGLARLSPVERVELGHDLIAGFASGALTGGDALRALEPLAGDRHGAVALVPHRLLAFVAKNVIDPGDAAHRTALRARAARLYAPVIAQLGWTPAADEPAWRRQLRSELLAFFALELGDPAVLAEAVRRGERLLGIGPTRRAAPHPRIPDPAAVVPDLAELALSAAAGTGGGDVFDALLDEATRAADAQVRQRALIALGRVRAPALVARALDLALDPRLRSNERTVALSGLLAAPDTRDRAWAWLTAHFDALAPLLPDRYAGAVPRTIWMCDPERIAEVRAFFGSRIERLAGGPRNLAQALEHAAQCAARVAAQRTSVLAYLDAR